MAKQPTQGSTQTSEAQTGQHPLLNRLPQVDELLNRMAGKKERQEFKIEELEEWKRCINGLAATPNGQLFLRSMIQFSGLFVPGNIRDTLGMVEDKCKAAFYLQWVRPYLDEQLRKEIE